jgi:GNAT superfamily N-acetyltransferase
MESNNEVNIQVIEYDINSDAAYVLLQELSNTLHLITGNSGEASFNKKDVLEDRSIFVIATIENEPIGCGAIRRIDDYTAEVKRMYARKNKYGVGTCILNYLENKAKDYGYTTLICETRKINQGAVAFYLKNGFHIIENYGKYVGHDEAVCFEKKIDI